MDFCIEDTRKKPLPTIKDLVKDGIIELDQVLDWLRSIYEIRFFEEKVFDNEFPDLLFCIVLRHIQASLQIYLFTRVEISRTSSTSNGDK